MSSPTSWPVLVAIFFCLGCQGDDQVAQQSESGTQTDGTDADSEQPAEAPSRAIDLIMTGADEELRTLLANGLDPNAVVRKDRPDITLLHMATTFGATGAIKVLIDGGADTDAESSLGVTPLLSAVSTGDSQSVLVLLELGANPNVQNRVGATPLQFACRSADLELVEMLLTKGADVNIKSKVNGGTALSTAVAADSLEIVECLLKHGADKDLIDNSGKKPVFYAKSEAVKRLVESKD